MVFLLPNYAPVTLNNNAKQNLSMVIGGYRSVSRKWSIKHEVKLTVSYLIRERRFLKRFVFCLDFWRLILGYVKLLQFSKPSNTFSVLNFQNRYHVYLLDENAFIVSSSLNTNWVSLGTQYHVILAKFWPDLPV